MMNKKDHYEIMFEQILVETEAIRELVADVPQMSARLTSVDEKVDLIDNRLMVIESIVRDDSRDIQSIKRHVGLAGS